MMTEITQFENRRVEIVRRPRQRNMNLRVRADGTVRVSCARGVARREIFSFILEQHDFIERSLRVLAEHHAKHPPRKFETGETFRYYGENLPLEIVWGWRERIEVSFRDDAIEMVAPLASSSPQRGAALFRAYQREARQVLWDRTFEHGRRMSLQPESLSVRGQVTRWGSCSSRGQISLNWKLLATPSEVIDYVIVHELAHLKHLNHSARFWALVAEYCPEYEDHKKWLRRHEAELNVQFQKISNES